MAYNEIFSVCSSINLIQPEKNHADDDKRLQLDSAGQQPPDGANVRFSPFSFSPSLSSAFSSSPISRRYKAARATYTKFPERNENHVTEERQHSPDYQDQETAADVRKVSASDAVDVTPSVAVEAAEMEKQHPPRSTVFGLCYCRRDLLPVKLFYFSFVGALGVIFPYCAVFLKQIGLSAFQIGIISGVRPVLGFVSAPIWGCLADRFNLRRSMMIVSMLAWLGFFVGFYFISAPERLQTPFPEKPPLHRDHLRFRRSVDTSNRHNDINLTFFSGNLTTHTARWNDSGCNYSDISKEDKELLKENRAWIYDPSGVFLRFIACTLIICGGEIFQAPTTALTDAATLQVLGRDNIAQYGAQRAWGPIGWGISSLAVGTLLSSSRWRETFCGIELVFSDYRIIAYVFIAVMVFGLFAGFNIDFGVSKGERQTDPAESSSKTHDALAVVKLFLNLHYGSWILTTFFVGFLNGIIWGFLFWHLDNLGGSQLLMGVDSIVMCVFEFASFFFVHHVIGVVGHMGIMYIGLLGYAIRFLIYASISNPWLVLPADALQGVTFSFIWVSLTAYTAIAVPPVSLATVQGIVHGVYFGLGNGLGHLIGGILIGSYGAVVTFYSFAAVTSAWLVLFVLSQKLSKKPSIEHFSYQDLSNPEGTSCNDQTSGQATTVLQSS